MKGSSALQAPNDAQSEVVHLYAVKFVDGSTTVASRDKDRMVEALKVYLDPSHPEDPPKYGAHLVRRTLSTQVSEWEPLDASGEPLVTEALTASDVDDDDPLAIFAAPSGEAPAS